MKIGNREFDTERRTYIMGILNLTPDSFSDGGRFCKPDAALFHVQEMIEEGADIIDIGGESTRPGHTVISQEEEIQRVVPIIEKVAANFDIPISIDTYKSAVAREAIDAGACMVNDIWGLKADEQMAALIAEKNVPCCLMHNRKEPNYQNLIPDMLEDLKESLDIGQKAGISRDSMILDPGIGFGKTYEMNLQAINQVDALHKLGCPVLLAASRKSVIGLTLELPAHQRIEGTAAITVIGVMKGCSFVRVHDVKENRRAIQMTEAILNSTEREAHG